MISVSVAQCRWCKFSTRILERFAKFLYFPMFYSNSIAPKTRYLKSTSCKCSNIPWRQEDHLRARDAWPFSLQFRSFSCKSPLPKVEVLDPPLRSLADSLKWAIKTLPPRWSCGSHVSGSSTSLPVPLPNQMQRANEAQILKFRKDVENRIQLVLSTMSVSGFKTRFY